MISFLCGTLLTLLQFALVFYCSAAFVNKLIGRQPLYLRLTATLTVMYWLCGVLFAVLILPGLFNRSVTSLLLVLLAAFTSYRIQSPQETFAVLSHSASATRDIWRSLPRWMQVATGATACVMLVRFSRGIIAPPLAWDALTYHLLKAGRWVQSGGWVFDNAPGPWQFYEYFPPLGDVYFAWGMLGTHTDAYLAWLNLGICLNCGLATYALARTQQLTRSVCWLAALCVVSVPAVLAFITANYVDNTALAIVIMGCALVFRGISEKEIRSLALGTLAMGLAVGIKITFLPYLAVTLPLLVYHTVSKRRWAILGYSTLGLIPCFSWQLWLAYLGHSPFYPAPFSLAGVEIEVGQPEFIQFHYRPDLELSYVWELPQSIWKFLLSRPFHSPTHHNFTLLFPLVLVMGFLGLYQCLKDVTWSYRLALLGIFLAGFTIFISFWIPATGSYRAMWVENMGRFFSSWYALLIVLSLHLWNRAWPVVFALIISMHLYEAWPRKWLMLDFQATGIGLIVLTAVVTGVAVILCTAGKSLTRKLLPLILIIGTILGIWQLRNSYRYVFFRAGYSYDIYLPGNLALMADAASYLDQRSGKIIAFSTGLESLAYKWFRYIFLGSRLQNKVVYVSPESVEKSTSSSVGRLRAESWKQHLHRSGVDYFFSTIPYSSEAKWALEDPAEFRPVITSGNHKSVLLKLMTTETQFDESKPSPKDR